MSKRPNLFISIKCKNRNTTPQCLQTLYPERYDALKLSNKTLTLNFHARIPTSPLNKYQTVRTNTISCSSIRPFDYCNPLSACEASEALGPAGGPHA